MKTLKHSEHALPFMLTLGLFASGLALCLLKLQPSQFTAEASALPQARVDHLLFYYSTLPRMLTAILCGAALSLSGALFQQVLRNPLASPTTLGISAGAHLALVIALLFFPTLLGLGRDLVALGGSVLAAGLVFLIGAKRGFSPFSLVMAGLVVSLWCGAMASVLLLLNEHYIVSLFIWGSGSLAQQSFAIPLALLPKFAVIALFCLFLLRPLGLLNLGEAAALAAGVPIKALRLAALGAAIALSAFVTSAVGVIGFIGLIAPILARITGARRTGALLFWASLIGAGLLFLTDTALMAASATLGDLLPTGALTAMLGSPLLLLLLPRLKAAPRLEPAGMKGIKRHFTPGFTNLALLIAISLIAIAAITLIGRAGETGWAGWSLLEPQFWAQILPLRVSRMLTACGAGIMLALCGTILQRLTGNELASPEVLGISAGATFGVTLGLFFFASLSLWQQLSFASLGAFTILALILLISGRENLTPERVLLGGISLSAMVDAIVGVLGSSGDPRAAFLMRWMSGSTYNADGIMAGVIMIAALLLLCLCLATRRWLDLLPLGQAAALALGVPVTRARYALLGLSGLLAATATLAVGPLSFIGLMAPHMAREAGFITARQQMLGAALIGALLMMAADWLGRMAAFPYELPAGIVSALIGAPFLIMLMHKKSG